MNIIPSDLPGVYHIQPVRHHDARGYFARTWCQRTFQSRGLIGNWSQCSVSYNVDCGTLRGMHFQKHPHQEIKLVRCVRGAIFDAVVDTRVGSPTFGQWRSYELSAESGDALYIPAGMAHGFQTLQNETEVCYQIAGDYVPQAAVTFAYDDPGVGIKWPLKVTQISDKDASAASLADCLRVVDHGRSESVQSL